MKRVSRALENILFLDSMQVRWVNTACEYSQLCTVRMGIILQWTVRMDIYIHIYHYIIICL